VRGGCVWGKKLEMRTVSVWVVGWKGKGEEVKGAEKGSFVCRPQRAKL
jgi:hypothetical protein